MNKTPITVAYGDGIGPDIMAATLKILEAGGAKLDIQIVEIGEKVYLEGHPTGIKDSTWTSIKETAAFLKAPITTPQGGGFKSLNVTIRTSLALYANIRPCVAYAPYVQTKHPNMDLVIIRENEEDLYAGIEYQQTPNVCTSIKLITRQGSEKIIRYAFEYAKRYNRKKVTCFTKDNIMKFSDGLFHKVYDEIAKEYPDIENEHWIIDIGSAKLADTPEAFDVIVLPNLYGDILSDVAAQISGSVGLVGSANIGTHCAMFEAIHGSAPRRAGQNMANPSALMLAGVLMLIHIGQTEAATKIHNAWLKTIEDGIHTYDIFKENVSTQKVGTKEFTECVVKNIGKQPAKLPSVSYSGATELNPSKYTLKTSTVNRKLVGTDVFIYAAQSADAFISKTTSKKFGPMTLELITNRGAKVYPKGIKDTFCIEQWRCRFIAKSKCTPELIIALLSSLVKEGFDIIKTENIYEIDGKPAYSSAKG